MSYLIKQLFKPFDSGKFSGWIFFSIIKDCKEDTPAFLGMAL